MEVLAASFLCTFLSGLSELAIYNDTHRRSRGKDVLYGGFKVGHDVGEIRYQNGGRAAGQGGVEGARELSGGVFCT